MAGLSEISVKQTDDALLELGAANSPVLPRATIGAADAVVTMIVCVIGGGLMSMPNFYLETGLIASSLFTVSLLIALHFSVDLLAVASIETGRRSYESIAFALFGWPGLWSVELCLFVLQFGTVCGYLVTMGELLEPLCGSRAFALILAACVLGVARDDNTLHGFVSWGRACVALYVLAVVVLIGGSIWLPLPSAPMPLSSTNGTLAGEIPPSVIILGVGSPLSVLRSLPVMFQAYTFQSSFFTMLDEVQEPSMTVSVGATKNALVISSVMYTTVGVLGVIALGTQPDADILRAHTGDYIIYDVLRAMVALMVALSFSLVYVPCRRTLDRLLFLGYGGLGETSGPAPTSSTLIPRNRVFVNSLLVLLVAILMTLRVTSLARVLTVTGSSAGIIVSMTLPAIFYLKSSREHDRRSHAATALLIGSVLLFVACFLAVITRPAEETAPGDLGVPRLTPRPIQGGLHHF